MKRQHTDRRVIPTVYSESTLALITELQDLYENKTLSAVVGEAIRFHHDHIAFELALGADELEGTQ